LGARLCAHLAASAHGSSWHEPEVAALLAYVSYWGKTGKHLLVLSFTGFDPTRTWAGLKSRSAAVSCSIGGVLYFRSEAATAPTSIQDLLACREVIR
jgi:hypothetical protein